MGDEKVSFNEAEEMSRDKIIRGLLGLGNRVENC